MKNRFFGKAPAILALLVLSGCTGVHRYAQPGDQVQVDFTCRLADGGLVDSTLAQVAGDDHAKKSPIFTLRDRYIPLKFKVGTDAGKFQVPPFAPLEQKIGVAIANRGSELPLERTTTLELPSVLVEKFPPEERHLEMSTKFAVPRLKEMPVQEFSTRYGTTPVKGAVVDSDRDFPGTVRAIGKDTVTIHFSARDGAKMDMSVASAFIREKDDENFEARMDVHEGQLIRRIGGLPGRVTAVNADKFIIDFGHSFAGETLFCDITARPFDPTQETQKSPIGWVEDFDKGLALARQQDKPVVLFLYSDECPYCRQMQDKVFPDPSLDPFKHAFVWLKINSEKQTEFADRFEQQGYPMIVVLNADGTELLKLSGLQHIATLAHTLSTVVSNQKKS